MTTNKKKVLSLKDGFRDLVFDATVGADDASEFDEKQKKGIETRLGRPLTPEELSVVVCLWDENLRAMAQR